MDLWIGAINLGFLFAFMAIGTFITYRLYSFPDITVDGTFTTGASIASVLIVRGWDPVAVLPVAFVAGSLAGFLTGFIHTRFKIEGLLAGILVMTALYSVNLHVMGQSNIPLLNTPSLFTILAPYNPGFDSEIWIMIMLGLLMLCVWLVVSLFLKSDFGLTMRATGNNPVMVAAQGIAVDRMKIFGISFSNGLVGVSGALVAQYQGFADIGMGIGSVIFSLAAVIIGEAIFRYRSVFLKVLGVIFGSVIFRLAIALALYMGMNPNDLKIVTAFFVLLTIVAGSAFSSKGKEGGLLAGKQRFIMWLGVAVLLSLLLWKSPSLFKRAPQERVKKKIGLLLANQSSLLTNTRNGFYDEIRLLGYREGENCEIYELNAEGDIAANRTMIDNLVSRQVDIFVTISTASTQAAINKVKDKPVVFATVANPFSIDAGTDPWHHRANVTGVYGPAPVKELLAYMTRIIPGTFTIGTIYNPAFPNTKSNLADLKKAMPHFPQLNLREVSVAGTNDVLNAAQSLASEGIRAFVLINDLTVFNALESVIKVSRKNNIPVFSNDAERIKDGVFLVYGYEYHGSGVQAARLVDRILKGESPAAIPFEVYNTLLLGLNNDVATALGIRVPQSIRDSAEVAVEGGRVNRKR